MATWWNINNRIEASSAAFRATNTQNRLLGPSTSVTTASNLANVVANGHFNFVFPSEDRDTLRLVHGIRVVCVDNDPAQLTFVGVYGNQISASMVQVHVNDATLPFKVSPEEHQRCPSWADFLAVSSPAEFENAHATGEYRDGGAA